MRPQQPASPTAASPLDTHSARRPDTGRSKTPARLAALGLVAAAALIAVRATTGGTSPQAILEARTSHEVTALFAGISQHQNTLGNATAPITLEVFADIKDPDTAGWFTTDLPAIVQNYVRKGTLKLIYHAYKTNTYSPQEFVKEQTAALAAGAQNKLWNYTDTFLHEQHNEFAPYATSTYLANIAHQIPQLNLALWHTDLHTGRREEQTTLEDQTARTLNLYVTPAFRIGPTGQHLHNYSGHTIIKNQNQHPFALPEAQDINNAIRELDGRQ
jgi:protein-disulfide isomerase